MDHLPWALDFRKETNMVAERGLHKVCNNKCPLLRLRGICKLGHKEDFSKDFRNAFKNLLKEFVSAETVLALGTPNFAVGL